MQRLLSEWVKLKLKLLKLSVCPRIDIDLAIELFNIETWNFQERYKSICYFVNPRRTSWVPLAPEKIKSMTSFILFQENVTTSN